MRAPRHLTFSSFLRLAVVPFLGLALPASVQAVEVRGTVVDGDGTVPEIRCRLVPLATAVEGDVPVPCRIEGPGFFRAEAPTPGLWKLALESPGRVPVEWLLAPLTDDWSVSAALAPDVGGRVRVLGDDGRPVVGARIAVEAPLLPRAVERGRGATPAPRTGRTDSRGLFSFPRAAGEIFRVTVVAPGFAATIMESESAEVEVRLRRAPPRQLELRDPEGRAVAAAELHLAGSSLPLTRTDGDGRAIFHADPRAVFGVEVRSADAPPVPLSLPAGEGPFRRTLPAPSEVRGRVLDEELAEDAGIEGAWIWAAGHPAGAVRSWEDGAFELSLASGAKAARLCAGAALHEATCRDVAFGGDASLFLRPLAAAAGTVVDPAGNPLPRVRIALGSPNEEASEEAVAFPDGSFLLPRLEPGRDYVLEASLPGYSPSKRPLPALASRERRTDLQLVLEPRRTAFGSVLDLAERPVPGAIVLLSPVPKSRTFPRRWGDPIPQRGMPFETSTDSFGTFEVLDVPAGAYDLEVTAEGLARIVIPRLEIPEEELWADLGTVLLEPAVAIEGQTVDPDGNPLAGVEVRADVGGRSYFRGPDGAPDAVTDSAGWFVLERYAEGSTVNVTATSPGYRPTLAKGVRVPSGDPLRLVLEAAATLSGEVTDSEGRGVAGAAVMTAAAEGGPLSLVDVRAQMDIAPDQTGEDGTFLLDGLEPGSVRVIAAAEGYVEGEASPIQLSAGEETSGVLVVLQPGASLGGRILDSEGRPVAGARVSVEGEPDTVAAPPDIGSRNQRVTRSDSDGSYRATGLVAGLRGLRVEHPKHTTFFEPLEIRGGENSRDVRLRPGRQVSGTVLDPEGRGVPDAYLLMLPLAGEGILAARETESGADGTFRIRGVAPGHYRLRVEREGFIRRELEDLPPVDRNSLENLEIRLDWGGSVRGRVLGLKDPGQVQIFAHREGSRHRIGTADVNGTFQFRDLAPGPWRLAARIPSSGRQVEETVTIPASGEEIVVDLEFPEGVTLAAEVLLNGQPAQGFVVTLDRVTLDRAEDAAGRYTSTDSRGRFLLEGLTPGNHLLRVIRTSGFPLHEESLDLVSDRQLRVEIRATYVRGQVLAAATSTPLAGAVLVLETAEGEYVRREAAGDDGTFDLFPVADGVYRLTARQPGYGEASTRFAVTDGLGVDGLVFRLPLAEP